MKKVQALMLSVTCGVMLTAFSATAFAKKPQGSTSSCCEMTNCCNATMSCCKKKRRGKNAHACCKGKDNAESCCCGSGSCPMPNKKTTPTTN